MSVHSTLVVQPCDEVHRGGGTAAPQPWRLQCGGATSAAASSGSSIPPVAVPAAVSVRVGIVFARPCTTATLTQLRIALKWGAPAGSACKVLSAAAHYSESVSDTTTR